MRIMEFLKDDGGQDLIEYAILAVFIALVAFAGVSAIGANVNTQMNNIAAQIGGGS